MRGRRINKIKIKIKIVIKMSLCF